MCGKALIRVSSSLGRTPSLCRDGRRAGRRRGLEHPRPRPRRTGPRRNSTGCASSEGNYVEQADIRSPRRVAGSMPSSSRTKRGRRCCARSRWRRGRRQASFHTGGCRSEHGPPAQDRQRVRLLATTRRRGRLVAHSRISILSRSIISRRCRFPSWPITRAKDPAASYARDFNRGRPIAREFWQGAAKRGS